MTIDLTSAEIALRLAAGVLGGAVLGLNRGQHGRPAGLRTTILVCTTATASLILANILLSTTGKAADSFVNIDVMRLPLGVLTGVGFIGAGAILHKNDLVVGVTTAATLWYATMMGFFFGAGELALGAVLAALGLAVLWGLDLIEHKLPHHRTARLILRCDADSPSEEHILSLISAAGFRITEHSVRYSPSGTERRFSLTWYAAPSQRTPDLLSHLNALPGLREIEWR